MAMVSVAVGLLAVGAVVVGMVVAGLIQRRQRTPWWRRREIGMGGENQRKIPKPVKDISEHLLSQPLIVWPNICLVYIK